MSCKRVLLALVFIMVFSFMPDPSYGQAYIQNIDVFFGDFDLRVENKLIDYHKKAFIYDDEIYISLADLSRALDIDLLKQNNIVLLNSKGKLAKGSSDSNQPLLFQKGYELVAKKGILQRMEDYLRALDNKGPAYLKFDLKGQNRNIYAGFNAIDIYLDGRKLELDKAALLYDGHIYVATDQIAPYLYITPNLSRDKKSLNIEANGVLIKDKLYKTDDALLSIMSSRNYLLDLKRAELERKRHMLEDLNLPYGKASNIEQLERYLNKNFGKIGNLNLDIKLASQANWIDLDVSFLAKNNFNWYRLSRTEVEAWAWNVYTSILTIYDEDILLAASIENPNYNKNSTSSWKNYVTFYTKDNDLLFDFSKSRLAKDSNFNPGYLMEILNISLPKYNGVEFRYETAMSGDNLELTIHPDTKNFNGFSLENQIGYLRLLNDKIREIYPSIITEARILYPDNKIQPLDFYIEENRIRSRSLLDKTEDYLNLSFSRFSYGSDDFSLEYSIYEKDLKNFGLTVVSDFSIEDEAWESGSQVIKHRIDNNVHNAISYIFSLWNANISTEVFDQRGNVLSEFDIFSENVSLVSASPESGEILEGSRVYLTTDTANSKIYYTVDDSTPTISSTLYTGAGIQVNRDTTIKAFGYKDSLGAGPVSTFNYTVKADENLSSGLTDLRISDGNLSPSFSRQVLNYIVDVDEGVFDIDIRASADDAVILINDQEVASGEKVTISLLDGENDISIRVSEAGKKQKTYTIVVRKETGGVKTSYSMSSLKFNTLFGLIFQGQVESNTVTVFEGYKLTLFVNTGKKIKTVDLNANGSFDFVDASISSFDKLFGFRYEVYDGNGKVVLGDNLAQ